MNYRTARISFRRCLASAGAIRALRRKTLIWLAVLGLTLSAGLSARAELPGKEISLQEARESHLLLPGKPVEREIQGGETHLYRIELASDQYVRIVVDQLGIDVVVGLSSPDGRLLVETDGPFGAKGAERISMVAAASGTYSLRITPLVKAASPGRYQASIKELRASTPLDASRVTADQTYKQAQELLDGGTEASRKSAIAKFKEALSLYERTDDPEGAAPCLFFIGIMNRTLGNLSEALENYERSLSLARSIGNRNLEATLLRETAKVFLNRKERQKALDYYGEAISVARASGDRTEEATGLNDLGWVYRAAADHQTALKYFTEGFAISHASGDLLFESTSLNNMALSYIDMSENQKGLDCLLQALPLKRQTGHRQGEGVILNGIGAIYHQLGDHQKALDYFKQALPLWQGLENGRFEAIALQGIGSAYLSLGDYPRSMEYLMKALQLGQATGDRGGEANTLISLSKLYFNQREYQKALDHARRSLEICRSVGNLQREAFALNHSGRAAHRLGDTETALQLLSQAVSLGERVGDLREKADALNGMAHVEYDTGDYAQARSHIESALKIIESIRGKVASREIRTSYFASIRQYYNFYIDLLMKLHQLHPQDGYDRIALEASEHALARNLLEALSDPYAEVRRGVDPALLDRERALKQRLNAKSEEQIRLFAGKHTDEQTAAAAWEIESLITELQAVQGEMRARSPRYAALTQPVSLTVDQIQRQVLDPDTLLLEYALGEQKTYVWAISRSSMSSFELANPAEVEAQARDVYRLLTERNRRMPFETAAEKRERVAKADVDYWQAAARLSRILMGPLAGHPGKKRLIIVADGALQYVPFAALPDPASSSEPLITRHEVVSLPSASTLAVIRQETSGRKPAPKQIAILADPVYDARDMRLHARARVGGQESTISEEENNPETSFAPVSFKSDAAPAASETRIGDARLRFPRLTFTRQEAGAIAALADSKDAMLALDFNASRETALGPELAQYRIVHLAAHGLLDTQAPDRSAIVLSLVDEQGGPRNGFLRLHDIYDMNLPAELVVLSACQTALGKRTSGEGLVGLTRGFMYAGSKRVMASLWKVGDQATAELMQNFYRAILKKGQSPAAALRTAQTALRSRPDCKAPFFWASFTLQGEYN